MRRPHEREAATGLYRNGSSHQGIIDALPNPTGRHKRDVWTITPKPYKPAHFATYPTTLVDPCILAATSARGVCPACGAPWQRVVDRGPSSWEARKADGHPMRYGSAGSGQHQGYSKGQWNRQLAVPGASSVTTGWQATCTCDAGDPVPATALDPFAGAGTTLLAAAQNGRRAIGIEANPDYVRLIHERLQHAPGRRTKARPRTGRTRYEQLSLPGLNGS
jgi:hypothetical protein